MGQGHYLLASFPGPPPPFLTFSHARIWCVKMVPCRTPGDRQFEEIYWHSWETRLSSEQSTFQTECPSRQRGSV